MSRKRVKHYLQLLLAVGVLAVAMGGGGTFASFNAETANGGNTFATGTLYLHDKVGGGSFCTSESTTSNSNVPATVGGNNPGDQCDVLFNFPATQKYNQAFSVDLTLKNAGTLDANDMKFQLNGTGCAVTDTVASGGTLSSPLSTGGPITTIAVTALSNSIASGAAIQLREGGTTTSITTSTHYQTFTTTAVAGVGATVIHVASQTPNFAYSSGDPVYAALGANNACNSIPFTITETNSTFNGDNQTDTSPVANGSGLTSPLVATTQYTSISVGALARAVYAGSSITLDDGGGHTQTLTVTQNAAIGATTINVAQFTANFSYPAATTNVKSTFGTTSTSTGDTTGYEGCAWPAAADDSNGGCLFSGADNIGSVPTRSPSSSFDSLTLSSGGGTGNGSQPTGLSANGGTRYFIITVFPQFGDPVMGETALFDMVWHMDQA